MYGSPPPTTQIPLSPSALSLGRTEGVLAMITESTTVSNQLKGDAQLIQQDASSSSSPLINNDIHIWALPTDCTALVHALLASFSVIIVSELGDKTFIITAIMAMKNSRLSVFLASACALLVMSILSVGMGVAVTVIPEIYTHYLSIVLFLYFGLRMLKEAYDMKEDNESESEFEEVKRSLEEDENSDEKKKDTLSASSSSIINDSDKKELVISTSDAVTTYANSNLKKKDKLEQDQDSSSWFGGLCKRLQTASLFINVFTMIFVAEWGDRSQISTVILAAREDVVGVFVGSFVGHILCSGLAVIGGKFVAEMISVRTMTLLGGIIFLLFATFEIISGP